MNRVRVINWENVYLAVPEKKDAELRFKNLNDFYLLYNDVDDLEVREDIIKKTLNIYRKYMEYNKYSDEENEKNIFNNNFYKNIPKVSFFEFLNLYKKYL